MGIMRLCVYLLVICIVSCLAQKDAGTTGPDPPHELVDPTLRFFAIIRDFVFHGVNFTGYDEQTATEPNYEPTVAVDDYEPQFPDVEFPDVEVLNSTDSYPRLCENLVRLVRDTYAADPSTVRPKATAFLKMIFYTMFFKAAEDETCHPVVKMLDIIILAAHKLRLEYTSDDDDNCTFTEVAITDKAGYMPTEQPESEKPKPYPRQTSKPESTTLVEYVTEASSKPPCSEVAPTIEGPSKVPCPPGKPEATTDIPQHISETPATPCPENETKATEKPYSDEPAGDYPTEEIIAEDDHPSPPYIGSVRGIPGEHYPNYAEIPITSFSCSDKKYIPGFYADLETGCQVFHVCYEHRRESFLCPVGTIFNQPILACDYWYSSNCSLSEIYYDVNAKTEEFGKEEEIDSTVIELISTIAKEEQKVSITSKTKDQKSVEAALDDIVKFLPVKVKVIEVPDIPSEPEQTVIPKEKGLVPSKKPEVKDIEDVASKIFDQILTTSTLAISKSRHAIDKIPEPAVPQESKVSLFKTKQPPLVKAKVKLAAKTKLTAALPLVKIAAVAPFVAKAKLAVPIATKTKVVAAAPFVAKAKLAVPIAAKAKVAAAASKVAIPIAAKTKVAAAAPFVAKAKFAVPIAAKTKVAAAASKVAIPVAVKGKVIAGVPVVKAAAVKASVPLSVKLFATMPKVAVKAAAPVIKGKVFASSIPLAKSAIPFSKAKLAPALKAKLTKTASVPVVKGKLLTLPLAKTKLAGSMPLVKAKLVKSAAISPLTKKALAIGYMKLLKAKKLAVMG